MSEICSNLHNLHNHFLEMQKLPNSTIRMLCVARTIVTLQHVTAERKGIQLAHSTPQKTKLFWKLSCLGSSTCPFPSPSFSFSFAFVLKDIPQYILKRFTHFDLNSNIEIHSCNNTTISLKISKQTIATLISTRVITGIGNRLKHRNLIFRDTNTHSAAKIKPICAKKWDVWICMKDTTFVCLYTNDVTVWILRS